MDQDRTGLSGTGSGSCPAEGQWTDACQREGHGRTASRVFGELGAVILMGLQKGFKCEDPPTRGRGGEPLVRILSQREKERESALDEKGRHGASGGGGGGQGGWGGEEGRVDNRKG